MKKLKWFWFVTLERQRYYVRHAVQAVGRYLWMPSLTHWANATLWLLSLVIIIAWDVKRMPALQLANLWIICIILAVVISFKGERKDKKARDRQ